VSDPDPVEALRQQFLARRYVADRGLAMAVHLSLTLHRPLLVEGEAGVGKTEVAKVLAEVLAAPVLLPERYGVEPRYFSDVVVRRDSPFASFEDLRGRVWGYNERTSHSGWNLVCSSLYRRGLGLDYFSHLRKTGSHLASLHMLERGEIDAAAIDSHVFDVARLRQPDLDARLRVIEVLGPSSIPPVVVSKTLDSSLKRAVQLALLSIHTDRLAAHVLQKGLIAHFVQVGDEHYEHIYRTYCFVQQWQERTFTSSIT